MEPRAGRGMRERNTRARGRSSEPRDSSLAKLRSSKGERERQTARSFEERPSQTEATSAARSALIWAHGWPLMCRECRRRTDDRTDGLGNRVCLELRGLLQPEAETGSRALRRPGQPAKQKSRCPAGLAAFYCAQQPVEMAERETGRRRLFLRLVAVDTRRTDGATDGLRAN